MIDCIQKMQALHYYIDISSSSSSSDESRNA